MVKYYFPIDHYDTNNRTYLFPLLRAFGKDELSVVGQEHKCVEVSGERFQFVETIEDADIAVLTMSWNHYVKFKKRDSALSFIQKAQDLNKTVWMSIVDDVGFKMPSFDSKVIVFRYNGYKTDVPHNHRGVPVFIPDPNLLGFSKQINDFPNYSDKPMVGFCGLASGNPLLKLKQIGRTVIKNLAYYLGLLHLSPHRLIAYQNLRFKLLDRLSRSNQISSNFIIRNQYRAGAVTPIDREFTKNEFYENITNSQYVLCVRGAGNFSTRLYETLAMGRIPLYIHSDDILPLRDEINWKAHVVWVDWSERYRLDDILLKFHKTHDDKTLKALSIKNRNLWEQNLQMGQFFKKYSEIRNISIE